MLSQKARYALHALIVLAEHGGREPMMIADIAEQAGVPRKFLEQILLGLKKRGIVQEPARTRGRLSARAAAQGHFLCRHHPGKPMGPLCAQPLRQRHRLSQMPDCEDEATCAIRKVLLAARDATAQVLESRTLAQGHCRCEARALAAKAPSARYVCRERSRP